MCMCFCMCVSCVLPQETRWSTKPSSLLQSGFWFVGLCFGFSHKSSVIRLKHWYFVGSVWAPKWTMPPVLLIKVNASMLYVTVYVHTCLTWAVFKFVFVLLLSFSKQLHWVTVYCMHLTALICPLQNRYMATIGLCSKTVSTRYSCMKFQHLHTFILPAHSTVQNNRDTSQSTKMAAQSKKCKHKHCVSCRGFIWDTLQCKEFLFALYTLSVTAVGAWWEKSEATSC